MPRENFGLPGAGRLPCLAYMKNSSHPVSPAASASGTPAASSGALNRRDFLRTAGRTAAVSSLAGVSLPHVFAAENNTLQVALIGAGGRGTGAADQALGQTSLPTNSWRSRTSWLRSSRNPTVA